MVKQTIILAGIVAAIGLSACDGGPTMNNGTTTTTTAPVTVRTVAVGGVPASLVPPGMATLTATATFSDNTTQNVTNSCTWDSTNTVVATVSGGIVTARAPGAADIGATYQSVRGVATVTVSAATLRANPGGPYQTQHNQNIVFSGLTSTSSPYPIVRYSWNCGQSVAADCDQDGPTPTFNYRKCGIAGRPACRANSTTVADYTVRLTITDSQGNTNAATTTVTVTNNY